MMMMMRLDSVTHSCSRLLSLVTSTPQCTHQQNGVSHASRSCRRHTRTLARARAHTHTHRCSRRRQCIGKRSLTYTHIHTLAHKHTHTHTQVLKEVKVPRVVQKAIENQGLRNLNKYIKNQVSNPYTLNPKP